MICGDFPVTTSAFGPEDCSVFFQLLKERKKEEKKTNGALLVF